MNSNYNGSLGKLILAAAMASLLAYSWTRILGHRHPTRIHLSQSAPLPAGYLPETEDQLQRRFNTYNDEFFDGKLPRDTVVNYLEQDPEVIARTYRHPNGSFMIKFNLDYEKCTRHIAQDMAHEMCHVAAWDETHKADHGSRFQACMMELAKRGAMREIW